MKKLLAAAVIVVGIVIASPSPVAASGAWVDRVENVDTVLAVRFEADFPLASLMRADCAVAQFVQRPDGSGVETLRCELSQEPVMIPAFQGRAPTSAFTFRAGACVWTSDYWFARDGSIRMASTVHYVVTPSGIVNATAYYPAEPLVCE